MTGSRRHAALLAAAVLLALATCAASNDATAAPVAPPANSTEDLIASEVDRPWQWTWQTGLGIALALVVSLSTAPGGQGGGYFWVPMFNVLLGFPVQEAGAMSSVVLFLGCISAVVNAVAKDHPLTPHRAPLVDYTSVLVMIPSMLLGVGMGVMLNKIMPAWFANVLMIGVWFWSGFKFWAAMRRSRRQETEAIQAAHSQKQAAATAAAAGTAGGAACAGDVEAGGQREAEGPWARAKAAAGALPGRLAAWWAVQPEWIMGAIVLLFVLFVGVSMARSLVPPCGAAYWGVLGVQVAYSAAFAAGVVVWLARRARCSQQQAREQAQQEEAEQRQQEGEPEEQQLPVPAAGGDSPYWGVCDSPELVAVVVVGGGGDATPGAKAAAGAPAPPPAAVVSREERRAAAQQARAAKKAARAAAKEAARQRNELALSWDSVARLAWMQPLMLAIGVWAGSLGLGGAAFISPLILAWGMHPQVAAGTCKLVLLLSTGGSAAAFIMAGRVNLVYALVYGGINVAATPVAIVVMDRVVRATQRPSYVTMLSLIVLIAGVSVQVALSLVPSLIHLVVAQPPALGFRPDALCAAS